jgi:curli biogenesis system outer membrane secretion channel CsgG
MWLRRLIAVTIGVALVPLMPTTSRAQAASAPDSAPVFPVLPRAERQKLVVMPLTFTAQLSDRQKNELNSLSNVVALWRGGKQGGSVNDGLVNLGRSAGDILVEQLMQSNRFRVIDRGNLGDSGSTAAGGVSKQAKALGASFLVTGSISKFAEIQKTNALGGLVGNMLKDKTHGILGGGMGAGKSIYSIGITVRIVDVESGEVIATYSTEGQLEGDKVRSFLAGVASGEGGAGGGASSKTSGERELKIAEALQISVANLVVKLVEAQMKGVFAPGQ